MYKQRPCMHVDLIHKHIWVSVPKCEKKTLYVLLKDQVLQEEITGGLFECKQRAT